MGRKFLTSAIILSALYGIYYFGFPAVLNLPGSVGYIQDKIKTESGYNTVIENLNLKMGVLPSAKISAENFAILNADGSTALLVSSPKADIRLLPLIFKSLDVKSFSAQNVTANLVFDKDKKLKLGQYEFKKVESPLNLNRAAINLNSYNINLDDKVQSKTLKLDGKYLFVDEFLNNKRLKLSTIADLHTGSKLSFLKADLDMKLPLINDELGNVSGYLVNFDLADFSDYANSLFSNQIKALSGIINLKAETIDNKVKMDLAANNLGIFKDDVKASIYFKDELKVQADINTIKNGLEIYDLKALGNGINLSLSGKVTKLNRKLPQLDLKVAVSDTKAENVLPLLPGEADLSPDIDLLLLKKTGFWGNASANLEIKGKADYPNVYGNVLVKDAYMVKPILNAEKATIKLLFTGDKMDLDVVVPTSKTETVFVKGPINLDKEKKADLYITSTKNVDLKTAQIVLNPLHDILHFDIGPVPVMNIRGKGGINLHVIGTRKNPHAWGQFWFDKAAVSFNDVNNMTLTNGSGVLDFDNQNTKFRTKSGTLFGRPVKVDGTCSLDGNLNFNVETQNQDLGNLIKIVKTSPMLIDIQKLLEPVREGGGLADFYLNLTGQVKDVNDIVFNKNIFAKGKLNLHSNQIKLKDLPLTLNNVKGLINFDGLNADLNLVSFLNSSKLQINAKVKNNICNAYIKSAKMFASDMLKSLGLNTPYLNDLSTIYTSFDAKYNGKLDVIEPNKILLKGKIYSNKCAKSSIIVDDANYELKNADFKLPVLKGSFKNIPFYVNLNAAQIFTENESLNGYFKMNSVDLNLVHDKALQSILPQVKQLDDFEFLNGNVSLSARLKNNNLNAYSKLDDIVILHKPKNIKMRIKSGNLLLKNNVLNVNKINAQLGDMPLFLDGKILNVQKDNPVLNIYINAKPTQEFFDQFYNNQTLYPIKLRGDVNVSSKLLGTFDNLNTKSVLNIAEDSNLYYMGAFLGDKENPVKIQIDNTILPNKIKLNHLQYDKIIQSQNNKPFINTQLIASGVINILKNNNIGFDNLKIKTLAPTDAKIFNIIFRKPFMKQGVFTSDLLLNGTSSIPVVKGKLAVTSIDIPFLDSTIKDINLDFGREKILISGKGTVLTNDILVDAVMKNKLQPPYVIENVNLKLADLNVNKITDSIRDFEAEAARTPFGVTSSNQNFDTSLLIANNVNIEADKITVKNINADNFKANLSLDKDELLNIKDFKFDIAEGVVSGKLKHSLKTHKTDLDIGLKNANALIMSEALFDLKGQVYGSVDGGFKLSCNGHSHDKCFETLNGNGNFKISEGRMPKLGSLEYLLKAGNLFKGGLTGLSINSIIDLITPLKTGNFESISGDINIENGIADNINVYSNGEDLNMYMTGSYNLISSVADMKIYGTLSKNITSVFGKIKNASLNKLFNTIPGINAVSEDYPKDINKIPNIDNATDIYRIFAVDINGDINGDNYVKSFKWVK